MGALKIGHESLWGRIGEMPTLHSTYHASLSMALGLWVNLDLEIGWGNLNFHCSCWHHPSVHQTLIFFNYTTQATPWLSKHFFVFSDFSKYSCCKFLWIKHCDSQPHSNITVRIITSTLPQTNKCCYLAWSQWGVVGTDHLRKKKIRIERHMLQVKSLYNLQARGVCSPPAGGKGTSFADQ